MAAETAALKSAPYSVLADGNCRLYWIGDRWPVARQEPTRAAEWATPEELRSRVAKGLASEAVGWAACEPIAEWFYAHRPGLERFAASLGIENAEDREDYFQRFMSERFMRVWKAFRNNPPTTDDAHPVVDRAAGFKAYFITSYRNRTWLERKRLWREAQKLPTVELDDARDHVKFLAVPATADLEIDWEWQFEVIFSFFDQLPPKEREIVEFLFRDSLDVAAIATRLGENSNCIRTRKSRALQRLRQLVYTHVYHVATADVFDWTMLSTRIREESGFLERVRLAFSSKEHAALAEAADGALGDDGQSLIVRALNHRVIDVHGFCALDDLVAVLGKTGASTRIVPPGHLRINRLVLDNALSMAIVPARKLVIL